MLLSDSISETEGAHLHMGHIVAPNSPSELDSDHHLSPGNFMELVVFQSHL